MTEDAQSTLQGLLSTLEELKSGPDNAIYATNSHCNLLISLNSSLSSCEAITYTDADRILKICLRYKMDMQCAPYVLSIKSLLIKFCKAKPFVPEVDFFPSALAVLEFLKYNCSELVENHLRKLSFLVLMSHPREVLSKLVKDHSPTLIETFGLFLSAKATLDAKVESLNFLQLLNCIPAYEKSIFVKQGIQLWLCGVLPTIVKVLISIEDIEKAETYLGYVELLTEELVKYNYFEYPEWENFLENVVNQKKFPMYILGLLEKGNATWHRIWITIIKLLLDYVTRSGGSVYTIINSMLPVVETAFRRGDSTQRVRAFACWNELIKNFAIETKSYNVGKRVKLIVIPLKLNNAKTEDAATAKFYTWWLFIRKFKSKLDAHADEILIPFLHFLFGEENLTKPTFWVGEVSERMKTKCLQAFVELIGHSDCIASSSRCTNIKPLEGKGGVITTVMLADHWNDWMYALKTAVKVVAMNYNPESKKNVRCIWKSLALLMTELLDNTVRRDWFNDLIKLLSVFVEESATHKEFLEIVLVDLVMPMFNDDRVQTLLDSKSEHHRPMHNIVKIITDKTFDIYYKRYEPQVLTTILQPLVTRLLSEALATPGYMILLLEELPRTDSSLILWTALVQATPQLNLCLQALSAILKWPFKMMSVFTDVQDAALAWSIVYNAVHAKLDKTGFVEEISKVLIKPVEDSSAVNYFILFALIAVLKHKPDDDKMAKLEALTYEMSNCEDFEPLIPSLVETLALTIDKMPALENENLAHLTLNCVRNIFKLLHSHAKLNDNDNTLTSKEIAEDKAKPCILYLNTKVLSDTIMLALETYLAKCSNETIKKDIIDSIAQLEESHKLVIASLEKTEVAQKEFASPKVQEVKNNRKKEARIVKTVVENGEEYVVVKSNWNFNPKNLTENQKEKFQRKRNIPALYQDLSQSQDEFKLSTWKTDSQDTSLSSSKSSKSTTNNDVSEVLKSIPSANIVPKIMENIMDSARNANDTTCINTSPVPNDKTLKVDKVATPKDTKSPRMALKDRVFRNVRNLIEKSSPSPRIEILHDVLINTVRSPTHKPNIETTEKIDALNQIDNVSKSTVPEPKPIGNKLTDKEDHETLTTKSLNADNNKVIVATAKKDNQNITLVCTPATKKKRDDNTNTALLSGIRLPRIKRKPKKFDDSLMPVLKKNRLSNNESQTDSQEPTTQPKITVAQVHTSNDNDKQDKVIRNKGVPVNTDDVMELSNKNVIPPVNKVTKAKDSQKSTTANLVHNKTPKEKSESVTSTTSKTEGVDQPKYTVKSKVPQIENKTLKESVLPKNKVKDVAPKLTITTRVNKVTKANSQNTTATNLVPNNTHDEKFESFSSPTSETKEVDQPKSAVKDKETQIENKSLDELVTPKHKIKDIAPKSTIKKNKTSRIEKELMIDMIEGHPFLNAHSEKRLTRKKMTEVENSSRLKSSANKLNKSKLEITPKSTKNPKEKKSFNISSFTVEESQEKQTRSMEDSEPPCSEDIIESSQDSTSTTVSVKSKKRPPTVVLQRVDIIKKMMTTQDLIQDIEITDIHNQENHEKTDIELSQNKIAEEDNTTTELTENMDTELMVDINDSVDIIVLDNTEPAPIVINLRPVVGPETQELAEADTQPNDPENFIQIEEYEVVGKNEHPVDKDLFSSSLNSSVNDPGAEKVILDITQSLPEAAIANINDAKDVSSPVKDDDIKKQDFLNNTLEISPIKIQSPERQKNSPSPETSSDFFVIKLSSPVHSDGEPFELISPLEVFTENKVSADERDASPPRVEIAVTDTSPSSSLSLKKNRPQGRPGGRAAQMLDLCVKSDLKTTKVSERAEPEEIRKGANTPARRNLRMLYSSAGENADEENDDFLKLQRTLPTLTSSPSVPILKRKFIDITDDATASPSSKRKRVSFHDPPVSTSVSVHKYIEPVSMIGSPPNSAKKRLERHTRLGIQSPKRLENAFNLDSVLSKTVESFIETASPSDDTQNTSLDITPVVEIVKTSELNDTDPFYPDLIDCKDPIDVIATELSSPAMRDLFVKELEGKVETVGDLAKMTEIEINRLCIKAPKIKVAKKVLTDYVAKRATVQFVETAIGDAFGEPMTESLIISKSADMEMQTDVVEVSSMEMQTVVEPMLLACTQTNDVCVAHTSIQTDESGSKTTEDTISSLVERGDFIEKLCEKLDEDSIKTIAEKLPTEVIFDMLMHKSENLTTLLYQLLEHHSRDVPNDKKSIAELSFLGDSLSKRYKTKDLHLHCIRVLRNIIDKSD